MRKESEFQDWLMDIVNDWLMEVMYEGIGSTHDDEEVEIKTFEKSGLSTEIKGLIIKLEKGEKIQLLVLNSK